MTIFMTKYDKSTCSDIEPFSRLCFPLSSAIAKAGIGGEQTFRFLVLSLTLLNALFQIPPSQIQCIWGRGGWRWAVCCQKVGKWDFLHYLVSHFPGRGLTIYSFGRKPINIFLHPYSDLLHCAKIIWFCRLDNFSNFLLWKCEWSIEVGGERKQTLEINLIFFLPIALKTFQLPITLKIC